MKRSISILLALLLVLSIWLSAAYAEPADSSGDASGNKKLTQEEAAQRVGKSRSAVTNALRLLNLSVPVADMVERGELSAGHARALLAVEDPALQLSAAKQVLEKSLSVRKTELLASKLAKRSSVPLSSPDEEAFVDYAAALSEELSSLFGRRVALTEKKNRGKIELFYDNADDREALIAALRELKSK